MTFPTPSSRPARSENQDPKALTGKTRIEARRRSSHLVTALTTCVWLLGILACGQAASQSVKCASMTVSDKRDTNFNGEYELYVRQVPAIMKSVDRVNSSQWYALTPGFTIATQFWANRVLCFEANAGAAPIYLKVVPSESYLNALKANGLDLRIRSTIEAPSDELMLIRDGVTPVQGRLLELKNFRSVRWSDPTFPFYWSPHSRPETLGHVPWLNIQLDFVVADSTQADSDARRTIVIPRGSDIALKVMALGHEATGLELFPLANSSEMTFGVCAPPVILVNNMSTSVATIDMGVVPLDLLKQEQRIEQPFSITVKPRPRASTACLASRGNKGPAMRFVATGGRFRNGLFHGESGNPAYPGNSIVGVQIRNGTKVLGANLGDSDTDTEVRFTQASGNTRNFTATVKYLVGGTERVGPFLIPVTLEAYYN